MRPDLQLKHCLTVQVSCQQAHLGELFSGKQAVILIKSMGGYRAERQPKGLGNFFADAQSFEVAAGAVIGRNDGPHLGGDFGLSEGLAGHRIADK